MAADGVDVWSTIPGYRAADGEAKSYERLQQATQGELCAESRELLAAFNREMPKGENNPPQHSEHSADEGSAPTEHLSEHKVPTYRTSKPIVRNKHAALTASEKAIDGSAVESTAQLDHASDKGEVGSRTRSVRIVEYSVNHVAVEIREESGSRIRSMPLAEAEQLLAKHNERRKLDA